MSSESMMDIVGQGRDAQAQASKLYGVVVGLVTNNKDPDKLGRVKVKFPWLADDVESNWARVAYPMGGKERGYWWIPEINDEVLVTFFHGDANCPFVIGGLYNGPDKPPKCHDITTTFAVVEPTKFKCAEIYEKNPPGFVTKGRDFNEDGKNDLRFIRSRSGHLFIFDDKADHERIVLCDKTGKHRLEIVNDKKVVRISSSGDDSDIEIIAGRKISLVCKELYTQSRDKTEMWAGTTFSVDSQEDMKHKSGANMKREAATNIDEKAGAAITYKAGSNFSQEAGASMTVKSGAAMSVKAGATGEFVASATMTVKGATVMIN
jgi:phage baseplate assembly protein gpV